MGFIIVYKIAQTKLFWDIDIAQVHSFINHVQNNLRDKSQAFIIQDLSEEFPELILKCYEKKTLYDLWTLREIMAHYPMSNELRRFFFVVITALLRGISTAATGWPYIAPRKKKMTSFEKNVIDEFSSLAWRMAQDIEKIKGLSDSRYLESKHHLIQGDSRNTTASILSGSVDHVFTSPPYLNNFDYADRTRLELYFWGEASTWGEISSTIRTKLITSATTQINRSNPKYKISDAFRDDCPETARFVENAKNKLADIRKTKGGKKSYDLLVTGYFNDMHQIVKDVYRVLRPKTHALFVLGDSAPYGIHIPTDTLIGDIGVAIGFENYTTEILRTRGGKWKANPQRHSVALRESIIILYKG